MVELNYKQISGIVLLVITLAVGTTHYVEETGEYTNCRGQWVLEDNGNYTCAKTGVTKVCYEIESRGSGWYRCWEGNIVEVEQPKQSHGIVEYSCHVPPNNICEVKQ